MSHLYINFTKIDIYKIILYLFIFYNYNYDDDIFGDRGGVDRVALLKTLFIHFVYYY